MILIYCSAALTILAIALLLVGLKRTRVDPPGWRRVKGGWVRETDAAMRRGFREAKRRGYL